MGWEGRAGRRCVLVVTRSSLSASCLTWSYVQDDINVAKAQHLEGPLRHLVYHMDIFAHWTNDQRLHEHSIGNHIRDVAGYSSLVFFYAVPGYFFASTTLQDTPPRVFPQPKRPTQPIL